MSHLCDDCGEPVEFDLPDPEVPDDNGITHVDSRADESCDKAIWTPTKMSDYFS